MRARATAAGTLADRRQISNLSDDLVLPALARTEVLQWRSSDGTTVEGLLTYPIGYRDGDVVPTVLNIHGGPAGVFSQSFTGNPSIYMIETFAERGYAVLRPNPRGSTGYGKTFRYANIRDWGLVTTMTSSRASPISSSGASPTLTAVCHGLELRWLYDVVCGHAHRAFPCCQHGRRAPQPGQHGPHHRHSGLPRRTHGRRAVGRARRPTRSTRPCFTSTRSRPQRRSSTASATCECPLSQGQELYTGLKRLGVPTEMVIYPRTPHGPREPRLLMDVTPRIIEWFERFKPSPAAQKTGAGQ